MNDVSIRPLLIISIIIVSIIFLCGLINKQHEATVIQRKTEINEKAYQRGVNLIKEQKWDEATVCLIFFHDNNYKEAKVLYNYASAKEELENGNDYANISMADFYMKEIPDIYTGPFKDDILKFKQECSRKNEIATKEHNDQMESQRKAEEEAKKIKPGSRTVRIGMSKEDAIISMGKPYDINRMVGSYGTHEQWCYNDGVYLYFDNGTLTSWQD